METKRPATPPVTRAVIVLAIASSLAFWAGVNPVLELLGPGSLSEPWRLLSATLLHGGMIHLVFNLLWTWQLGTLLELALGKARFLTLVVALALASSLAGELLEGPGIGLSGVVYGMFGTLWIAKRRGLAVGRFLTENVTKGFVAWFFIAIAIDYLGFINIGNVAHGAGAVAGLIAGLLLPGGSASSRDETPARRPSSARHGSDNPLHRSP